MARIIGALKMIWLLHQKRCMSQWRASRTFCLTCRYLTSKCVFGCRPVMQMNACVDEMSGKYSMLSENPLFASAAALPFCLQDRTNMNNIQKKPKSYSRIDETGAYQSPAPHSAHSSQNDCFAVGIHLCTFSGRQSYTTQIHYTRQSQQQ